MGQVAGTGRMLSIFFVEFAGAEVVSAVLVSDSIAS
jgi:hypothetical protein